MEKIRKKTYRNLVCAFSAFLMGAGFLAVAGVNPFSQANAAIEESGFYSEPGDNLFEVDGYGDLVVSVIKKDDGTSNGPLAFCLAKLKFFPGSERTLYSSIMDKSQYTWDLGDGRTVTETQVEQIERLIYDFEFVHSKKLTDYGLDKEDTMSLYHATQLATWTIAEGWSTSDVKKASDTVADERLNALADKIYSLYVDMYNYAINPANATFKAGTKMIDVTKDAFISDGTTYTFDSSSTVSRDASGATYYRSSLMSLSPNQPYGTIVVGDYAWTYTVELVGAPAGARVVNEKGAEQYTFSTANGLGTDFYIEVPTTLATSGSFTVNVKTKTFYRLDTLLWNPVSSTGYQSMMQPAVRSDNGSSTFTISYPAQENNAWASIKVTKEGRGVKSYQLTDFYGEQYYQLVMGNVPLAGAKYEFYLDGNQTLFKYMSDGNVWMKGEKILPGSYATDETGDVTVTRIPMDITSAENSENGEEHYTSYYKIVEVEAPSGYRLGDTTEKIADTSRSPWLQFSSAEAVFFNDPIEFSFEFNKVLVDALGNEVSSFDTSEANPTFGLYNVDPIKTQKSGTIPADSLIQVLYVDENGLVSFKSDGLPANHKYYLKELLTWPNYELDTNTYYIDATVPEGSDADFVVDVTDKDGNVITKLSNYLKTNTVTIEKQIQYLKKDYDSLGDAELYLSYKPITSGEGYQFDIYEKSSGTFVKSVTEENFADGVFTTELGFGEYYIKEVAAPDGYELDTDNIPIILKGTNSDTETVTFFNKLKSVTLNVNKYDITNHRNDLDNAPLMTGVTFQLSHDGVAVATKTTVNGVAKFTKLYANTEYTLTEVVPVGYISETETQKVTLTEDTTVRVNNYLDQNTGSITVTKTDSETGAPLEGVQFSVYASTDYEHKNPVAVDTTDKDGKIVFNDLAAKLYSVIETGFPRGYVPNSEVHSVDLTMIKNGENKNLSVTNEPYYGYVRVTKTEFGTNTPLSGAEYGLYEASTDRLIETKMTDDNGMAIFSKQPYGSSLYVKEISAPEGYALDTEEHGLQINSVSKRYYDVRVSDRKLEVSIQIRKIDSENDMLMLEGATFSLYLSTDYAYQNALKTVTTDEDGLALLGGLEPTAYILVETTAPEGYELPEEKYSVDLTNAVAGSINTVTITNTKTEEPQTTELTVNKVWADSDNAEGKRPEKVYAQLLNGQSSVGDPVELNDENNWKYTWADLSLDGDWTVSELDVPDGYTSIIGNKIENSITITNTYTPKPVTKLTVEKIWTGDDGLDVRPENIKVQLLDGTVEVGEPITLSAQNNWKYTWENLDDKTTWTVAEVEVPENYTSVVSDKADNKITITNIYVPPVEKVSLTVNKVWTGIDDYDVELPSSIKVQLVFDDGISYGSEIVLSEANNWKYTWTELDPDHTWTVKEVEVPESFKASVSDVIDGNVTITNTYVYVPDPEPETFDLTAKKVWENDENYLDLRPDSVTIALIQDGSTIKETVTLNEANNWTHVFEWLDKSAVWSVTEYNIPEGYTANVSSISEDNQVIITNTLTDIPDVPELTEVTVTKVWNDNDNENELRPDSVQVQLYKDGDSFNLPVILNNENGWTYTWTELNAEYSYTVSEVSIPDGYTSAITGNMEDGFIITNTVIPEELPETTWVQVKKEWVNDNENVRPDYILVQLFRNTELYGDIVRLDKNNNWTYTWEGLDADYIWTATEVSIPDGYNASISSTDKNHVIITNRFVGQENPDENKKDDVVIITPTPTPPSDTDAVDTGDNSLNPILLVSCMVASATGILVLYIKKNKNSEQ